MVVRKTSGGGEEDWWCFGGGWRESGDGSGQVINSGVVEGWVGRNPLFRIWSGGQKGPLLIQIRADRRKCQWLTCWIQSNCVL